MLSGKLRFVTSVAVLSKDDGVDGKVLGDGGGNLGACDSTVV